MSFMIGANAGRADDGAIVPIKRSPLTLWRGPSALTMLWTVTVWRALLVELD